MIHSSKNKNFWKYKAFEEMTLEEWEALCDGCGKCCLHKLRDQDTGKVFYTSVACRLLNIHTCRCMDYDRRTKLVSDCQILTPDNAKTCDWLPKTCAYRLLAEGKDLFDWHPLISGDTESVHNADISLRGKALSEHHVNPNDLEAYVIDDDI